MKTTTQPPAVGEAAKYPRADWQYEVANGDTSLGYREWLEHRREQSNQAPRLTEDDGRLTPYALGLETNEETAQIINAKGWHVATVSISPVKETAQGIIDACNSYESSQQTIARLRGALENMVFQFEHNEQFEDEDAKVIAEARSALASTPEGAQ